jgi:hypothetical protein
MIKSIGKESLSDQAIIPQAEFRAVLEAGLTLSCSQKKI